MERYLYIMKLMCYSFWVLLIISPCHAVEKLPAHLIDLQSYQGMQLFKKNANENTLKLMMHFTTQEATSYCGIASATMVLNAAKIDAPIDPIYKPYHYFTQDNFFNDQVNQLISAEEVSKSGIDLMNLSKSIQIHGLKTKMVFADELSLEQFRAMLKNALDNGQFAIVNFLRTALKERGGGHHSPLAAYDAASDRFLLLDVARYKYSSYWVSTHHLWQAVNTRDGDIFKNQSGLFLMLI